MNTGLVWCRNDLRVSDNEVLLRACQNNDRVIAVYFFDPKYFRTTKYGFKKTGKYRAQFLIESVRELRKNLQNLNIPLLVFQEKPEIQIPELISKYEITDIYFQKEWTQEEKDSEDALNKELQNIEFHSYYQQFLYHPEDIPFESFSIIPKVFTDFRKACEKNSKIRGIIDNLTPKPESNMLNEETSVPELSELGLKEFETDNRSAFSFKGGEDQAKKRIQEYFWDTKSLSHYKNTRNGLIGPNYSSKLSAWLANGCISAKQIYYEVKKYENEITSNQSTYWLIFELIWRDFFKYVSLKHGNKIFKIGGILEKDLNWNHDEERLAEWINGETDEDFVNANMKEISATGFMSNRGRQNVNSYWTKELKQDWRIGAAYFESILIDYDVHSNWGNWMYNSGVGNDPRDRKFNIKGQAERYDPDKEYQNLWLKN